MTAPRREDPAVEALADLIAAHRPVVGRFGTINPVVGCSCLDRVFVPGQERYETHLAAVLAEHGVTLIADRETHPTTRLTDEESARIVSASIAPDRVLAGRDGYEGSPPDVLLVEVERILAERTLAAHPATDQPEVTP